MHTSAPYIPDDGSEVANRAVQRKWLFRSLAVLTVFALVYAVATAWVGYGTLVTTFSAVPSGKIVTVIALVVGGVLIRACRWHYYTWFLDWEIPALPRFTAFVAGFAFTATPGKAGELVKGLLLRGRYDVSLSQTAGILLVERLGDLLAVIVLSCGGLFLFSDLRVYVLIGIALIGGVTAFAGHPTIGRTVFAHLFAISRLRAIGEKFICALDAGRHLLSPLPMAIGGGMALVAWGCEAWAFHLLIGCFGIHLHYLTSFSIYGLSTLAGALSMLPGGLGGFEVVMGLLLTRLATPMSVATIVVIVFRVLTLWLFSLIGFVFMIGWMIHWSRDDLQQQKAGAQ